MEIRPGGRSRIWIELATQAAALGVMMWGLKFALQYLDPYKEQREQAKKRAAFLKKHLGRTVNDLNEFEQLLAAQVMNPEHIEVTLEDVMGLENIVAELETKVLYPMLRPELYCTTLWRQTKGVLLYGPPGTGKTMLARALAKQSHCFFLNITASSIMSKWLGDANRLVRAVFSLAAKLQPCIIFIDEVDAMLGKRGHTSEHEATLQVKTEFMQLWDGMESSRGQRVVVMGATNRPWQVDEAVLRRFTLQYEVGLPVHEQRKSILRGYLRRHAEEVRGSVDPELIADDPPTTAAGAAASASAAANGSAANGGSAAAGAKAGVPNGLGGSGMGKGPAAAAAAAGGGGGGVSALDRIAAATEGFSGSDLLELCSQAAQRVLAEHLHNVHSREAAGEEQAGDLLPRPMGLQDLQDALKEVHPSTHKAEEYNRSVSSPRGLGGLVAGAPMSHADIQALMQVLMQLRGGQ